MRKGTGDFTFGRIASIVVVLIVGLIAFVILSSGTIKAGSLDVLNLGERLGLGDDSEDGGEEEAEYEAYPLSGEIDIVVEEEDARYTCISNADGTTTVNTEVNVKNIGSIGIADVFLYIKLEDMSGVWDSIQGEKNLDIGDNKYALAVTSSSDAFLLQAGANDPPSDRIREEDTSNNYFTMYIFCDE